MARAKEMRTKTKHNKKHASSWQVCKIFHDATVRPSWQVFGVTCDGCPAWQSIPSRCGECEYGSAAVAVQNTWSISTDRPWTIAVAGYCHPV
jgi:hypothetical protein